ncbi:unnamed protein product [Oikopleura dioica]|uniref:Large ribosomal subunit protein mL49 n=1 Tax=Oikopleura dioica TaxID=34765 RepID=E4WS74_OIKDI|nr:unnamed protein product [Oikopleura dioica]
MLRTSTFRRVATSAQVNNINPWKFVEDILPPIQIPQPDMNQKFPTPTGWQPPSKDLQSFDYPFFVERNRFHELDLVEEERSTEFFDLNYDNRYQDKHDIALRKRNPSDDLPVTHLYNCSGDIFQLRHEICQYLEELSGEPVAGQADEPEARITVTGKYAYFIREFLYKKGF